ncbi:aa3-type cytochrome c oxidase subunit IV [Roseovarius amoyensis]|nr:aa3-type cytochrome c oxidase subunit IV [Roseovarius amoyensis]
MSKHKHGEMDITAHEKTFEGFIKVSAWTAGVSAFALIVIAIING